MSDADVLDNQTRSTLGMVTWSGLGLAYPELIANLNALYKDRVQPLGFIPVGWLDAVQSQNGAEGNLLVPAPPYMRDGSPTAGLPPWLQDKTALDIWQNIWSATMDAINSYAAADEEAGKAKLQALYDNAAFWSSLYSAVGVIGRVAGEVKAQVSNIVGGSKLVVYGVLGLAAFAGIWWLVNQGKGR